jgi:hypothetical protein
MQLKLIYKNTFSTKSEYITSQTFFNDFLWLAGELPGQPDEFCNFMMRSNLAKQPTSTAGPNKMYLFINCSIQWRYWFNYWDGYCPGIPGYECPSPNLKITDVEHDHVDPNTKQHPGDKISNTRKRALPIDFILKLITVQPICNQCHKEKTQRDNKLKDAKTTKEQLKQCNKIQRNDYSSSNCFMCVYIFVSLF